MRALLCIWQLTFSSSLVLLAGSKSWKLLFMQAVRSHRLFSKAFCSEGKNSPQLSHQIVLILSWSKNKNLLQPWTNSFCCCNALTGYQKLMLQKGELLRAAQGSLGCRCSGQKRATWPASEHAISDFRAWGSDKGRKYSKALFLTNSHGNSKTNSLFLDKLKCNQGHWKVVVIISISQIR